MTIKQRMDWFDDVCSANGIDPAIALENENVRTAIKAKDWAEVVRLLACDF